MKILCFFPFSASTRSISEISGGERRFIEICKRWINLGNEVHVIGSNDTCHLLSEFNVGATSYVFDLLSKPPGISDFINIKRVLKRVPPQNFDFLYNSGELFFSTVTSVLMKRKLKIPLVTSVNLLGSTELSLSSSFLWNFQLSYPRQFFRRVGRASFLAVKTYLRNLFFKKIDLIFSVSEHIRELLIKIGINKERIYTVGAGIDYDSIQAITFKEKLYDACFMGSIQPRKGVFDLIKLWKEVIKKKTNAKLLIIGGGSPIYVRKMKELIRKHNLDNNVKMTGFISGKRKYKLLKQSEIFVFPSYHESFAQVICEAMACGLPVIAYDLPVYHEWYENDIAYVKKGNVNKLVKTVLALLDDEKKRRIMSKSGLERAKKYTWDSVADYELKVIKSFFKIKD